MSLESAKKFKKDLKSNPELAQKCLNRSIDAIIKEASNHGYDFTIAELSKVANDEAESTLSDDVAKITRENFADSLNKFIGSYTK